MKKEGLDVTIYSDSQYIVIGTKWLAGKISETDFKGGKKNKDLWMRFYKLSKKHTIRFKWVRGHADDVYNNRCDVLATKAAVGSELLFDEGYSEAFWIITS